MKWLDAHMREILRFSFNLGYAVCNFVLGMASRSGWFITVGVYYMILSVMRLLVMSSTSGSEETQDFIMKFSGFMIVALSLVLSGIVVMTVRYEVGVKYHEIVMIAIALYAFVKLTLAIMGLAKSRKQTSPVLRTARSISFTDAVVSIYSLQRSMLVSFEGMTAGDITLFNALSGIGMCLIVIAIGINLMIRKDDFSHGKIKNRRSK